MTIDDTIDEKCFKEDFVAVNRIKFTEISLQNSLLPKKSHHLYEIFIEVGEEGSPFAESWSVSKRYSEFVNLRSKLSKTHPKIKVGVSVT